MVLSAYAVVGIIRALNDMALSTFFSFAAISSRSKSTANGSSKRYVNMRIRACSIRAVAAKEVSASRNTVIGQLMGEVAVVSGWARTLMKESFADGDLVWIMRVAACGSIRAIACTQRQYRTKVLTGRW